MTVGDRVKVLHKYSDGWAEAAGGELVIGRTTCDTRLALCRYNYNVSEK